MQRIVSSLYVLLLSMMILSTILTILKLNLSIDVYAASSPFARQEIEDGGNDWIYYANESYVSKNNTPNYPGIETVTYSSDGKFLNGTIWLSSPFQEKPSANALQYLMYIDVDSNNKTGYTGADYAVGVRWDNSSGTWFREFLEFSKHNKMKVINEGKAQNDFFDKEKNSVRLSIDLSEVNSPNQYNIAFSIEDSVREIYDTTSWLPIPPPKFSIATLPSSLVLRPGDEKTVELQINSTTNLQPEVLLYPYIKSNDIILNIHPNRTIIPSYGFTTLELRVKVLNNPQHNSSRTFPIFSTVHFSLERLNTKGMTINNTSYLTITVLPSLTIPEYINSLLSTWGSPVKELVSLITAIGGLGIGGWLVQRFRKKRKSDKDEKQKNN